MDLTDDNILASCQPCSTVGPHETQVYEERSEAEMLYELALKPWCRIPTEAMSLVEVCSDE